ncbi:MAG: TRL domain-containing protein [Candidatus Sumerlaeia bacterium]|nr:TRL domain-containing protein [Candidatus Sumerlaeia bacterium]
MKASLLALIAVVLFTGCNALGGKAPVMAPAGLIFEQTKVPLMHEQNSGESKTTLQSGRATSKQVVPYFAFLSVAWQDDSLKEAMLNGGIRELHHADIEHFTILGIYREQTVIAYGTR